MLEHNKLSVVGSYGMCLGFNYWFVTISGFIWSIEERFKCFSCSKQNFISICFAFI